MKDLIAELRKKLIEAVPQKKGCGLLFSGGLDSSVIAAINPGVKAITISLETYGADIDYSTRVADFVKTERLHRPVGVPEALEAIPDVIRILKSFDPAIPNDLAVYFGLKKAKDLGLKEVLTGDGSDEIFGGYSFMRDMADLPAYIRKISQNMWFSSNKMAEFFGITLIQPFMQKNIVDFALEVPVELKIKEDHGKWILRKAFENMLPDEAIWQDKRPLESGSGMSELRKIISEKISDKEFTENSTGVKFRNKEHLYYYKIYKEIFGRVPTAKDKDAKCPACGTEMKKTAHHCRLCGYCK